MEHFQRFKLPVIMVLAWLIASPVLSQDTSYPITTNSWPSNLEELDAFRTQNGSTPEGAVISLVAALNLLAKDSTEGAKGLVLVLDSSHLQADTSGKGYKGFSVSKTSLSFIERQLSQNPMLMESYLPGSSPSNGYTPSEPPYSFTLTSNRFSGDASKGTIKLFIPCSGASTPRPVTVTRNSKGVWKAKEFSSLIVGVAKATNTVDPADDI